MKDKTTTINELKSSEQPEIFRQKVKKIDCYYLQQLVLFSLPLVLRQAVQTVLEPLVQRRYQLRVAKLLAARKQLAKQTL